MNSSKKGSAFERSICRQLSLWVSGNTQDDLFWRTAGSGARATSRAKKGISTQNAAGDISYLSAEGKPLIDYVTFELKKGYNAATIGQLFNGEMKPMSDKKQENLLSFFRQAMRSAAEAHTPHWMVIHKPDNRDAMCYMDDDLCANIVRNLEGGDTRFRMMTLCVPGVINGEMMLVDALRLADLLRLPYSYLDVPQS